MASPRFFYENPAISWKFYEDRRQKALRAQPNAGHRAIAELACRNERVFTITQNIDGALLYPKFVCVRLQGVELSDRAGHPSARLVSLHGSLFDVKCSSEECNYSTTNYSPEPTFSEPRREVVGPSGYGIRTDDIEIPFCPSCGYGLLRPGVVWFGEKLPHGYLERIDHWFESVEHIDVIMVVGTEALVQPAASYIHRAAERGARVMYFNKTRLRPDQQEEMDEIDIFVQGNVAESLPSLIGHS